MADPVTSARAQSVPPYQTPGTTSNVHVRTPAVRSSGGFSTGMLVASVFVVVGILAYFLLWNSDTAAPVSNAPGVVIENNQTPAAPAGDPAPAATPQPAPVMPPPATPVPDAPVPADPTPADPPRAAPTTTP